jgi:hypothetical protein
MPTAAISPTRRQATISGSLSPIAAISPSLKVGDDVHSLQPACVKSDRASANITLKQACTLNKRRVWWRAQARCRQCWTASWTTTAGHCKAEDDWHWGSRR